MGAGCRILDSLIIDSSASLRVETQCAGNTIIHGEEDILCGIILYGGMISKIQDIWGRTQLG